MTRDVGRIIATHNVIYSRDYDKFSLLPDAKHLLEAVRAHWHIENRLYWMLDMAFGEDENRSRKDHAPQNLAVLRHIVLNLHKQEVFLKVGVEAKLLHAGWDERYLQVLYAG